VIHVECEQGSVEWISHRLGIPTASRFGDIITEKTVKPSASAEKYIARLVAEWMLGMPLDEDGQGFMARGTELEASAVAFYELQQDIDVVRCGFCLTDDQQVGASPDRFVGEDGLLEIKVPSAMVHVGYLLGNPMSHRAQVQGQLYVCEREWADLLSWHPTLPPSIVRKNRDDVFLKKFEPILKQFVQRLDEAKQQMIDKGYKAPDDRVGGWLREALAASVAEAE